MKHEYIFLGIILSSLIYGSKPAHIVASLPQAVVVGARTISEHKYTQTEPTPIQALVTQRTINQFRCAFIKSKLNILSNEAAANDLDSAAALKLFKTALYVHHISIIDYGNNRAACEKLLACGLIEPYAEEAYRIVKHLRKAIVEEYEHPKMHNEKFPQETLGRHRSCSQ